MIQLNLCEADVDLILELITRKIEKANSKEIDESQVQYLKTLESLKTEILVQVSS